MNQSLELLASRNLMINYQSITDDFLKIIKVRVVVSHFHWQTMMESNQTIGAFIFQLHYCTY